MTTHTPAKETNMKLVISSMGPHNTDSVDPRFGRARFFILFDSETGSFDSHDNSEQVDAPQGAGVQAAQLVVELGAEALLTGHCGPKAFQVFAESNIQVYSGFEGTVQDAVEAWKGGNLHPLSSPDGIARH